jgi:hypothetical protein
MSGEPTSNIKNNVQYPSSGDGANFYEIKQLGAPLRELSFFVPQTGNVNFHAKKNGVLAKARRDVFLGRRVSSGYFADSVLGKLKETCRGTKYVSSLLQNQDNCCTLLLQILLVAEVFVMIRKF